MVSTPLVFYIVQLQIIYLLNLQCNVPLTRDPSAIAKPLVQMSSILSLADHGTTVRLSARLLCCRRRSMSPTCSQCLRFVSPADDVTLPLATHIIAHCETDVARLHTCESWVGSQSLYLLHPLHAVLAANIQWDLFYQQRNASRM